MHMRIISPTLEFDNETLCRSSCDSPPHMKLPGHNPGGVEGARNPERGCSAQLVPWKWHALPHQGFAYGTYATVYTVRSAKRLLIFRDVDELRRSVLRLPWAKP
jgi:hypothetical protein